MPRKTGQLKKGRDVQTYINELEEVYGIRIDMQIRPKNGPSEVYAGEVILKGYWAGDEEESGPLLYLQQSVITHPPERLERTLLHALVLFTYQCVEAYISALPPLELPTGPTE